MELHHSSSATKIKVRYSVYNFGGEAFINDFIVPQALESAAVDGNECDSSGYRAGSVILKKINNKAVKSSKWGNEAWMCETEVGLLHVSMYHLITWEKELSEGRARPRMIWKHCRICLASQTSVYEGIASKFQSWKEMH